MNYKARLQELNNKLERGELTEAERAEIHHISTMALLELRKILERRGTNGTQHKTKELN